MTYNLKNRPFISIFDIINTPISESTFNKIKEYRDIVEAWFEKFEEQEREKNKITAIKIEELGDAKQIPLETLGFLRGYLQRGKEILGEVEGK